jgi:hypothetical protein
VTFDVCIATVQFAYIENRLHMDPKTTLSIAHGKTLKVVEQGFTIRASTECLRRRFFETNSFRIVRASATQWSVMGA